MEEQVAAYVARGEKGPLPPPASEVGFGGRFRRNLFATPGDTILTLLLGAFAAWVGWSLLNWTVLNATFQGTDRTACLVDGGGHGGACWPFITARLEQFIYGLYPIAERWRVNIVFLAFAVLLVPLLIPSVPLKRANAVALLGLFPFVSLILLTGGNFSLGGGTAAVFFLAAAAMTAALASGRNPLASETMAMRAANALVILGLLVLILSLLVNSSRVDVLGLRFSLLNFIAFSCSALSIVASLMSALRGREEGVGSSFGPLLAPAAVAAFLIWMLSANFRLPFVPTNLWGGLLITLVVAIVGIVASLPIGVLLALGRQSKMPAVRLVSIIFIEFWRGVPLITVLFMANFMLPLFLPSGVTFNQLLRVLVGVSLFAAAYMAEVIRGGLQAIPRGQYEGADAMGLSYWQKMRMIILPQALTLVIPGIVNTFIGLFKDTSLVYIIGLADLLGTVRRGFSDPNWITPSTPATGLIFAGFIFWLFCFSMSRYSIFMERRLAKGHRR